MHKQNIRVSDAIPEVPLSFDRTVERTLKQICIQRQDNVIRILERKPVRTREQRKNDQSGRLTMRLARRIGAASVAAMLILGTIAIGSVVIKRSVRQSVEPSAPLSQGEPVEQSVQPSMPVEPEHTYSILLLPELEEAEVYATARQSHGQPAFTEEDWGWLRRIEVSVEDIKLDGESIAWTNIFRIPKDAKPGMTENPFATYDKTDTMDLFTDDASVIWNGSEQELVKSAWSDGAYSFDETDDAWTIYIETIYERPVLDLSGAATNAATVKQQFRILDNLVDSQANIATIGMIEQSFRFDASVGEEDVKTVVTERNLSGAVTLSVLTETGRLKNVRVNLDGVVLNETVRFLDSGIQVTYSYKSVPENWNDDYRRSFLLASMESISHEGFTIACTADGETVAPEHPNVQPFNEISFRLPIEWGDARFAETGCTLELSLQCVDTFNGEPVGDNWEMPEDAGSGVFGYEVTMRSQSLATITLPMP